MTLQRAKQLLAALAVALFLPGSASTALADDDTGSQTDSSAPRHERVIDAWLAEQRHAGRRR